MSRWFLAILLAGGVLFAADELKKERPKPATAAEEEIPPEEDTGLAVQEYSFNPLQSDKEVRIGNYYFKKGSFRAAAKRFLEATKWNAQNPDAWLRLAETQEKQKDSAAREAYTRYLELEPNAANAVEIRKKIAKKK